MAGGLLVRPSHDNASENIGVHGTPKSA